MGMHLYGTHGNKQSLV